MKIALFGATGGTGRQFLSQALASGHEARALLRSPEKIKAPQEGLAIISGNVLDYEAVLETLRGSQAAVVILGNAPDNPDNIVSEGTRLIIAGMQQLGLRRLLAVTSLGVGDSRKQVPLAFKIAIKTMPALKNSMADKEIQEKLVIESGLDWTIVRPGGLTDGPATGKYRSGLDSSIVAGQVSRADVAAYILEVLPQEAWIGKTPAVT